MDSNLPFDERSDRLDDATRRRLATLSSLPVETSRLERRLRATLGVQREATRGLRIPVSSRWSLVAAVLALSLLLVSVLGPRSAAVAAPAPLFELHTKMVTGEVPVTAVDGEGALRTLLQNDGQTVPALAALPPALAQACCIHTIKGEQVLGALLNVDGRRISVVFADLDDMDIAGGHEVIERAGRRYVVYEANGLQMVMTTVRDRFVCVIGDLPAEQLVELIQTADR